MRHRFTLYAILGSFALALLFSVVAFSRDAAPAPAPPSSGYHVIKTIPVGGDSGWDYVYVDSDARRVYISHGTHTVVLDADSYAVVGDIADTQGVHGIAVASDLGRGFTSNGRSNDVTVFDLKTFKPVSPNVKTDQNPDAILYEPVTKRVFTFNGRGKNATAINAADGSVLGNIDMGGKPEFSAADGKGGVYVNNEDTSELYHVDAQNLKVLHHWPLAPCKSPSGLAIDAKSRRLFSVCDEKVMAVTDADTGKVVATPAICDGPDAAGFDPATSLVFASCGDGNLTVIHEDSPDKFTVVENVATKRSARTMGLDLKTHNIFLPAADFDPPAPGERRGKMKPGSFVVVVVGK
jgi:DNA-binding beta-propeller fold protein YncE